MKEFIRNMPKAELHIRIEGSLESGLMFQIAQRNCPTIQYGSYTTLTQMGASQTHPGALRHNSLDLLAKAYEDREGRMTILKFVPEFNSLRSDSRYANLVRRVGLVPLFTRLRWKYQKERKPLRCHTQSYAASTADYALPLLGITIRISGAARNTQGTIRNSLRGFRCMLVLGASY